MNLTSLKLVANTDWSWTETVCNRIVFFKDASNKFTLEGSGSAAPYTFSKPAQNITAGKYLFQSFLNNIFVGQGEITIYPNLATDEDPRLQWTRIYQNLMGAIEALSTKQAQTVNLFDGTQVTLDDLTKLIQRAKYAESKMNEENGRRISRKVLTRFY